MFDTIEKIKQSERKWKYRKIKSNRNIKKYSTSVKELSYTPNIVKSDQTIDILEIKGKHRGNYIYVYQSINPLEIIFIWISGKKYEKNILEL